MKDVALAPYAPETAIIIVNLVLFAAFILPAARRLRRLGRPESSITRYVVLLFGVYFVESVAVAGGMGVPVFSVIVAPVWGIVCGRWAPNRMALESVPKAALVVSLYSSLPALSFLVVPLMALAGGRSIISAEGGAAFGIPRFLPWPADTILGFYAVLSIGALLLKTALTTFTAIRIAARTGNRPSR